MLEGILKQNHSPLMRLCIFGKDLLLSLQEINQIKIGSLGEKILKEGVTVEGKHLSSRNYALLFSQYADELTGFNGAVFLAHEMLNILNKDANYPLANYNPHIIASAKAYEKYVDIPFPMRTASYEEIIAHATAN